MTSEEPEGWQRLPLEETIDVLDNKRTPLNSDERYEMKGSIPYYGANGVVDFIDRYIFDEELILIAEDGGFFEEYQTRPIAYRISGKSWVNNHAHVLRVKSHFCFDFIFYSLEHKNVIPIIKGGTRTKLNQAELRQIPMAVPKSLLEQKKIAAILKNVDNAIDKTKELIEKHKRMKQGLMEDLFNKGIDENGQPNIEFKNAGTGQIPKTWHVDSLASIASVNPPKKRGLPNETRVSFVPMDCISIEGRFEYQLTRMYSEVKEGFTSFVEGDVLFAKITPCMENGKGAFAQGLTNGVGFGSTEFHVLRAKNGNDPEFLYYQTMDRHLRLRAEGKMTGTAGQQRVPASFFFEYKINIPEKDEQRRIAMRLRSIDKRIQSEQSYFDKLVRFKTGLMQDLLTGQVRVAA